MLSGFLPAAGTCAAEASQSLALLTERLLRAGTTGINSECSSKSAYTNHHSQREAALAYVISIEEGSARQPNRRIRERSAVRVSPAPVEAILRKTARRMWRPAGQPG